MCSYWSVSHNISYCKLYNPLKIPVNVFVNVTRLVPLVKQVNSAEEQKKENKENGFYEGFSFFMLTMWVKIFTVSIDLWSKFKFMVQILR